MVANAGTASVKSVLDTTLEDIDQLFNINFRSTFLAYKYAAKQMIAQGRGGRIIGTSLAEPVLPPALTRRCCQARRRWLPRRGCPS
jgi:NAD(P)-dependent dehydrogenase (short-subunit alcohol dehydrogenase family)